MKKNEIKKANVATLKAAILDAKLEIPADAKKADCQAALTLHFFPPSDSAKVEVLETTKQAKKIASHRLTLSKVYDAAKLAIEGDIEVSGLTLDLWKKEAGVTFRFATVDKESPAIDKAIHGNLLKALKSAGVTLASEHNVTTACIRKAGASTLYL
tara:strand:- start:202 stop:669 length:468 start_codon:yes stop_codon:yes gene_type:complete